jgi:hypothetical protein
MKSKMKSLLKGAAALLFFSFVLFGCEPPGWDYILEAPGPIQNVTVENAGIQNDTSYFDVTFTVPTLRVTELYPEYTAEVLFYYRKSSRPEAGVLHPQIGTFIIWPEIQGTEQTVARGFDKTDVDNGGEYIFTLYVSDAEGQLSEGVDSPAFVISW